MGPDEYKFAGMIVASLVGGQGLWHLAKTLLASKIQSGEKAESDQKSNLKKQVNGLAAEKDRKTLEELAAIKAERDELKKRNEQSIREDIAGNRTEICHIKDDLRAFQTTWAKEVATSGRERQAIFTKLDKQDSHLSEIRDTLSKVLEIIPETEEA